MQVHHHPRLRRRPRRHRRGRIPRHHDAPVPSHPQTPHPLPITTLPRRSGNATPSHRLPRRCTPTRCPRLPPALPPPPHRQHPRGQQHRPRPRRRHHHPYHRLGGPACATGRPTHVRHPVVLVNGRGPRDHVPRRQELMQIHETLRRPEPRPGVLEGESRDVGGAHLYPTIGRV